MYDFSDDSRANITWLPATTAEVGLFVNVRIGPYTCAEWNFGGLPVWLWDLPSVVFHDNNAMWKRETWCQRSRWAWGALSPLISGTMHSNRL